MGLLKSWEAQRFGIINMALDFTGMIRLFESRESKTTESSKERLQQRLIADWGKLSNIRNEEDFKTYHSAFCDWGVCTIHLAKSRSPAAYGQIAKTLDVALKVIVYYCQLPNPTQAKTIQPWLNAGLDTKMMDELRKQTKKVGYQIPPELKPWPVAIHDVDGKAKYEALQKCVREYIRLNHRNDIAPVQYDDIYWLDQNKAVPKTKA